VRRVKAVVPAHCVGVDEDHPDTNYNDYTRAGAVHTREGSSRFALIRLESNQLPSGTPSTCTLHIFIYDTWQDNANDHDDLEMQGVDVADTWDEATVTANTDPNKGRSLFTAVTSKLVVPQGTSQVWKEVDITTTEPEWTMFKNYGLQFRPIWQGLYDWPGIWFLTNHPNVPVDKRPFFRFSG